MMRAFRSWHLVLIAAAVSIAGAQPARAQLPNASTAALGMGDNYTAAARGYHAVRWNPANLGLLGNPGATIAFFSVRAVAGLDPITLADVNDYSGVELPVEVRRAWLAEITAEGSEQGAGGAHLSFVAAQFGRFGLQIGSRVDAVADLPPGAAELLLFGNVDENGNPKNISFANAALDALAASTGAISYAHPLVFGAADQRLSLGVTLKYTVGHFILRSADRGGQVTANPIAIRARFPTVMTDTAELFNNGSGFGLDVGLAWQRPQWTLSAAVQNVFNTFEWKAENLRYRPGNIVFNADSSSAEFDEEPFAAAPADVQAGVLAQKFKPSIAVGLAFQPNWRTTLAADFRTRLSDEGITFDPKLHAGLGAEFRILSWLPIRAGAATLTDGFQIGGGLGIDIGSFSLAGSVARRSGDLGHDFLAAFTFISSWPRGVPGR